MFLCSFHSKKCGRNPVFPYVVMILVGVWTLDDGRAWSQNGYYLIFHCELFSYLLLHLNIITKKNTVIYYFSQFCSLALWTVLLHLFGITHVLAAIWQLYWDWRGPDVLTHMPKNGYLLLTAYLNSLPQHFSFCSRQNWTSSQYGDLRIPRK